MNDRFIVFDNVCKEFQTGNIKVNALDRATFGIDEGEVCVILGASGAGKTTLLNLLGGMDRVTDGTIMLGDNVISSMNKRQLTQYRRDDIGFVFQFYNLIPNLTALENVEIAAQICQEPMDAKEALRLVGLEKRINSFPAQLSGGEQQRVAIARAIAKNPKLLLCDEPTGALDYRTGKAVLSLLQDISHERGMTVVIITHNKALTDMADRIIEMRSGRITDCTHNHNAMPVAAIEW